MACKSPSMSSQKQTRRERLFHFFPRHIFNVSLRVLFGPRKFSPLSYTVLRILQPPMATSGQKATPEGGLACLKCQEPTLLKDSIASGRNMLRRNCLECVSTDKWLTRCCRKPKPTEVENDDQKERREKAEQLKAQISKMSSAEKAAWYICQAKGRTSQAGEDQQAKFQQWGWSGLVLPKRACPLLWEALRKTSWKHVKIGA